MRRILALWMLLTLGLGQAMPADALVMGAFSALTAKADESRVPACCRKGGQHHCAVSSMSAGVGNGLSSRETSVSAHEVCPFAPHALAATAPTAAAILAAFPSASPAFVRQTGLLGPTVAAPLSDRRSQPKRGPPALQLL